MSRRRLSKNQRRRIQQRQSDKLSSMDADATVNSAICGATVVTHYGVQLDVVRDEHPDELVRCVPRQNLAAMVVGDRVAVESVVQENQKEQFVITAIGPRESLLERPDPYGKMKPIAANVDQILLVVAPVPTPSTALIDRYIAAIELADLKAVLVFNKLDLWLATPERSALLNALEGQYRELKYSTVRCSAKASDGMEQLGEILMGRRSVFVGQSGVGKSTLVNGLIPAAQQSTKSISEKSDLGQHTTTLSKLFFLDGGGVIMDSPGIREFGLWHIDSDVLIRGFVEFDLARLRCKFRNCTHRSEPGCAILAGLQDGSLSHERWKNYSVILAGLDQKL